MPVQIDNRQRKFKLPQGLKKRIQLVLDALGYSASEVSLLIVNDARIRKLNAEYRQVDRATDVLSFPLHEDPEDLDLHLLGDVVVSAETASRQARSHGLTFNQELILLIIHGILHLTGMDHERSAREDRKMRQKTGELFQLIFPNKIPDPSNPFF